MILARAILSGSRLVQPARRAPVGAGEGQPVPRAVRDGENFTVATITPSPGRGAYQRGGKGVRNAQRKSIAKKFTNQNGKEVRDR